MCTNCGDACCAGCLTVPKGDTGEKGDPSAAFLNFMSLANDLGSPIVSPFNVVSLSYREAGRIAFSNDVIEPFTLIKYNAYVEAGGIMSLRIRSVDAFGVYTQLYENTNITSNNPLNMETADQFSGSPLSIAPGVDLHILIEIKTDNVLFKANLGSFTFGYK